MVLCINKIVSSNERLRCDCNDRYGCLGPCSVIDKKQVWHEIILFNTFRLLSCWDLVLCLCRKWKVYSSSCGIINTLRPRQDGRHFPDDSFKRIFLNKNVWISINISLKFVPKGPINNIPTLVQVMAWRRPGDKPLSELMMVRLPTHICVTRPQWVNVKK